MIITRGAIATQVGVHHAMRKHPVLKNIFGRVIGLKAITLLEGQKWKEFRAIFNPAFAASNIVSFMPAMLEEGEIFVSRLSTIAASGGDDKRGGYTPSVMRLLKDLTADIIMRVIVGTSTHCQESSNELIENICAASRWPQPASINPLENLNFTANIALMWYDWRCNKLIQKIVMKRWEEIRSGARKPHVQGESKVMLDITLFKYQAMMIETGRPVKEIDPEFLDIICDK